MSSSKNVENDQHPIIFFDGVCNLCNGFVAWLIKADKAHVYRFASLQGETAKQLVGSLLDNTGEWSVVVYENGVSYDRSDAVLKIFESVGGVYRFFLIFKILPKSFRDYVYRLIARSRYRIFGKKDVCRVPNSEEASLFLP
jgi:predicted DCC family thiol-disulfide oxidoreductase YuxK